MPRLTIDLMKISDNARLVAGMIEPFGVRLVGVTKACLGNRHVAGAMLAGGAGALADSRSASIARLRRGFPDIELQLLRSQPETGRDGTPADLCFVSSAAQAKAVVDACGSQGIRFCLVIETGDGRDGVAPGEAADETVRLAAVPGAVLAGVATNAACASGAPSLSRPLDEFYAAAQSALEVIVSGPAAGGPGPPGRQPVISAGGSGLLGLLLAGEREGWLETRFGWLTDLRCGEALLLGNVPFGRGGGRPLPGAHTDAFRLEAPVLEASRQDGRDRVLVGLGIQDIGAGEVTPLQPGLAAGRATSDYLEITCDPGTALPAVGDRLAFTPSYYALLAAMTSPFVEKVPTGAGNPGDHSLPLPSASEDSVWDS